MRRTIGIDWYTKDDVREAMRFCDILLLCFNIESAGDTAWEYNNQLDKFCNYCSEHPEHCNCDRWANPRENYDDTNDEDLWFEYILD